VALIDAYDQSLLESGEAETRSLTQAVEELARSQVGAEGFGFVTVEFAE
jgi:hypothetical protein